MRFPVADLSFSDFNTQPQRREFLAVDHATKYAQRIAGLTAMTLAHEGQGASLPNTDVDKVIASGLARRNTLSVLTGRL